jgi:hypothetical protein
MATVRILGDRLGNVLIAALSDNETAAQISAITDALDRESAMLVVDRALEVLCDAQERRINLTCSKTQVRAINPSRDHRFKRG